MLRTCLLALVLLGCAPSRPPLILVSLDGFRWDYLDRGLTPTLSRLARDGVRARWMVPVFPTKTFPNHFSIVTGRWPAAHGIVGNEFVAPELSARFAMSHRPAVRDPRFWLAEPVWVAAERKGLRTAAFFWPGSEAPIGGLRPSFSIPYDGDMPDSARVRRLLGWLDLPPERRPAFLTLYTSVVDHAGHEFGPDAPETREAIVRADSMIALLLEGLARRGLENAVNLVIVSDHGMAATAPERVIVLDDHVDTSAMRIDALSPVLMAQPRAGLEDSVYRSLRAVPHLTVYSRNELPARYRLSGTSRVPSLVAVADEGWLVTRRRAPGAKPWTPGRGDHGYDDTLPSMRAIFLGHGPGFQRGLVVPPFRNIHVYPLLAELLGLEPGATDASLDSVKVMLSRERAAATSGSARPRASPPATPAPAGSSAAPAQR
jgi:predicted AlkP superfamily pyrophosphatase or phosphodiesterase